MFVLGMAFHYFSFNEKKFRGLNFLSNFSRLSGRIPDSEELLQKEDTVRLKRCIYATQRSSLPPITTHNVVDDAIDPVLSSFRRCQLFNEKSDRVKVITLAYTND